MFWLRWTLGAHAPTSTTHYVTSSHIEPLAAELGFPHMLSKTNACNGRVRTGVKGNAANRGSGERGAHTDGAASGTGDRASTTLRRSSAAPPTSPSPNLEGPRDRAPANSPSQAQSTSILSPPDYASPCGTSAGPTIPIDGATDPDMGAVSQASIKVSAYFVSQSVCLHRILFLAAPWLVAASGYVPSSCCTTTIQRCILGRGRLYVSRFHARGRWAHPAMLDAEDLNYQDTAPRRNTRGWEWHITLTSAEYWCMIDAGVL